MIQIMSNAMVESFRALPQERQDYAAGDLVFRRDGAVEWLHFVDSGLVHLLRYKADGGMTVLQRAEPNYFLAEASLFSASYHCDAQAITDSTLIRFRKSAVINALKSDPDVAAEWAKYLSREVQRTRARAELLAMRKLSDRLDAWLEIGDRELPEKGQWISVAREIGVSPEALYRHLAATRMTG